MEPLDPPPRPPPSSSPSSSRTRTPTQLYLLIYNTVSLLLWSTLTLRLLLLLPLVPPPITPHIHAALSVFARTTQTLALLEPLHALFGLVRAPVATTAVQVASRLLLVWGIVTPYPRIVTDADASGSWAYLTMLGAWGCAEIVRYGFFALTLSGWKRESAVVDWVSWLRYNAFVVLYPVGILSECWLIYCASVVTPDERVRWALWGVLGLYVPGSYVMMGHMVKQRRRVRRGKGKVL